MNLPNIINHSLERLHIYGAVKNIYLGFKELWVKFSWGINRRFGSVDKALINDYLSSNTTRKLHIACGTNVREGWLNTEYYPFDKNIIHLDATRPFPIEDNTFDYIFNEHMIEHIPYEAGQAMLNESYRVLRDNGRIRIATPSLQFLINLYTDSDSGINPDYIKWSAGNFIDYAPYADKTFVINNFVRDWGHVFIYDEAILRKAMEKAGFSDITAYKLNDSSDEVLRGLEHEERMPAGFLQLETMILEGVKRTD